MKNVTPKISNRGQSCQSHTLRDSYAKNYSHYRPPIEDPSSQNKEPLV